MIDLAEKIRLSEKTVKELKSLIEKRSREIDACAVRCRKKGYSCLKGRSDIFRLAVILKIALDTKERYEAMGIDREIFYDTMSDIKIWCDKTAGKGIKNYGWLKNHLNAELFRLGRLQFQLYPCSNKTLLYNKLPFSYGENLIYVHIPEGEPLSYEECQKSLKKATVFFERYFPSYEYRYFFCESWLLYEGNREFMSAESNIVRFMELFDICYSVRIDAQAIERIFGKRRFIKRNYPEKTSLQKRTKEYILSGKRPGVGIGIIKKENILKKERAL